MRFTFTRLYVGLFAIILLGGFISAYGVLFTNGAESATDSAAKSDFRVAQSEVAPDGSGEGEPTRSETFQDWTLLCHDYTIGDEKQNRCRIQQVIVERDGSQRQLLYVALFKGIGDSFSSGLIRTPLGIVLPAGIDMRIDPENEGKGFNFIYNHCLPRGCIAPLSFSEEDVVLMQRGSRLQTIMLSIDRRKYAIDVSLNGFTNAFNRLTELSQ